MKLTTMMQVIITIRIINITSNIQMMIKTKIKKIAIMIRMMT